MQGREWWRGAVIYQVYLPSFLDSDGDGTGDLPGLRDRLGYIADLGVDAIWISPFYPSPQRDFGYDVVDYRSIDPRFGSQADFDRVVARAHKLGLKVLIDQVWSHTSSDHPWFEESRASAGNARADWYVWADPREDGTPPNNWLSVFGGSAWRWEPTRRQYYLHHFLPTQPKLNLRNKAVLAEHFTTAEYWLGRGVDGFRLDAVDFMLHDPHLGDNPANPATVGAPPINPFRMQQHLRDMSHADTHALIADIRTFMNRYPEATTIGELSSEPAAARRVAAMTGKTRLHMAYTLAVSKSEFSAAALRKVLAETIELRRSGWPCWSFNNHDVARAASRWNASGIEPARFAVLQMALLLSLPGSASLFQGEELGLPNAKIPLDRMRDPFGLRFYPAFHGRDGSRTPMPWAAGVRNLGFSRAEDTWLPIAPAHAALTVDRQQQDPLSTLAAYRAMLAWRKRNRASIESEVSLLDLADPLLGFRHDNGAGAVIAIFNFAATPAAIPLSTLPRFQVAEELGFAARPVDGTLGLPPFGVTLGLTES
ncbi:MAG TPA: alpha-amylase family glycosyl hydrolase [Stellaceae bacterium]|nr:alpha-amylase family glycosyl hydrolase [Stellaceae bacterium]